MTMIRRAVDWQVGGNHYRELVHQPRHLVTSYALGFHEGSIVKYVTRWKAKGGLQDLRKALHFAEMLIEDAPRLLTVQFVAPVDANANLPARTYCRDNGLGPRETLIILAVVHWQQWGEVEDVQAARNGILELINDAKREGWS